MFAMHWIAALQYFVIFKETGEVQQRRNRK
jgi:hypothetical protein